MPQPVLAGRPARHGIPDSCLDNPSRARRTVACRSYKPVSGSALLDWMHLSHSGLASVKGHVGVATCCLQTAWHPSHHGVDVTATLMPCRPALQGAQQCQPFTRSVVVAVHMCTALAFLRRGKQVSLYRWCRAPQSARTADVLIVSVTPSQ